MNGFGRDIFMAVLFCAVLCAARAWPADRASGLSGEIALVLEQAIRFQKGNGGESARQDLHVDLVCRDGRVDPAGWAWFEGMAGIEHKVQVTKSEARDSGFHLEFAFTVADYPPAYQGGIVSFVVDVDRLFGSLHGSYAGTVRELPKPKDDAEADAAWPVRKAAPGGRMGRLVPGATQSAFQAVKLAHQNIQGIVARGVFRPLPGGAEAFVAPAADEHPRLLFRRKDVAALRAGMEVPKVRKMADGLRAMLAPEGAAARAASPSAGFKAAGWGLLYCLTEDRSCADKAGAAARLAVADFAKRPHDMALASELAGVALAYDCCHVSWTNGPGKEIAGFLAANVRRFCARSAGDVDAAIFGRDRLGGEPVTAHDYRLGALRAAAGLAALAVSGDTYGGETVMLADEMEIARRTVTRVLRTGVGWYGAGNGNYGFDEMVLLVFPYLQAYRANRGVDPAEGTGAEWIPAVGMLTRGLCFNRGCGFGPACWLPAMLPFVAEEHRSAAVRYLSQHEPVFGDPWQAALALINVRETTASAAGVVESLPLSRQDWRMGFAVMRSGWDDKRDFVTIFETGESSPEAAAARGSFSIYGLGREWVSRFRAPDNDFSWPVAGGQNVVHIEPEGRKSKCAIVPGIPGYFCPVRMNRDGSGSVSMLADGAGVWTAPRAGIFRVEGLKDVAGQHAPEWVAAAQGAIAWRTLGVDYSGESGAAAVFVIVEGVKYWGPRSWEIHVGEVKASEVKIEGRSFLVRPGNGKASMKGTVLYAGEDEVRIAFVPSERGGSARLVASLTKPSPVQEGISLKKELDTDTLFPEGDGADADLGLVLDEKEPAAEEKKQKKRKGFTREELTRLYKQQPREVIGQNLLRHISSISMGGGDRKGKVHTSIVVVLTIQEGDPPAVVKAESPEGFFCKIGGQVVNYREYMVQFGGKDGSGQQARRGAAAAVEAPAGNGDVEEEVTE